MSDERLTRWLHQMAAGATRDFAWLDGGPQEPGWVGIDADRVIEGDDLRDLEQLDRAWKAEPEYLWVGWIDYELGVDALLERSARGGARSGFCARRYPKAHRVRPGARPQVKGVLGQPSARWPLCPLRARLEPATYRERIAAAIEYIRAGDTYQINLSQSFDARLARKDELSRLAAELYLVLRRRTPASMGALIQTGPGRWLVSNSPETLFEIDATGSIASWPIKGTRPRHEQAQHDEAAAAELLASEKDLAEHVMIVDLVRNDLGRISRPGSVSVAGPPKLESFPTVHHLVSEVRATLPTRWSLDAVVRSLFPGGSITGAPKRRTCELIEQLEGERRGIYCGAIFVLSSDGARFSIPIRTGELSASGLELRSGGGIVVDSDPEAERLETLHKARAFDPKPDAGCEG